MSTVDRVRNDYHNEEARKWRAERQAELSRAKGRPKALPGRGRKGSREEIDTSSDDGALLDDGTS